MKYYITILFSVTLSIFYGQTSTKQKADSLSSKKERLINDFLQLSPLDDIADIGTGSGYSLIPIANQCPTCKFTVEDIDSASCNRTVLLNKIYKSGDKTRIENFTFYYGTEKATNLPSSTYTKVLVFDVIHELKHKGEMLSDIKRILKLNGAVFIEEILVHSKIKKDKACNYPFLTEIEFKKVLADNNFLIEKEQITFDNGNNRYIKLFKCESSD